jgi:D-alanyl-D-alanine carboxypeptidase
MKTKAFALSILALCIFTCVLPGQSFNKAKLDSLLDLLAEKNKAMGSLAMSENGNILYTKAIGFSSITPQQKIASNEKTKYRIGSISKMFTATIIFQLIEEGKLDLSTTLDKYFPEIPNAKSITIGNMLSHRSGIHSFTDDSTYLQWSYAPKTHDEIIKIISAGKPEFEPDSKTAYSNSNFVLLGYIVEKICNKPYDEALQERVCTKIGLKDTYYGSKTDISKNESFSYSFGGSWLQQPETDMSIPHGAGAIVSTSSDLVKFIEALFTGKLLSESSLSKMKTITDSLGMGMMQFPYEDKTVYGHGGAIDGFNSILCYFPDEKLAFAYCSNGTAYPIKDILLATLSIYFGKPYTLPVFTTFAITPEELDQYLGTYSSAQVLIKITFTKKDGILYGQGTGQPSFPLEATAKHVFKFEMAGVLIIFNPEKNEFLLEQGGGKFTFTKDK